MFERLSFGAAIAEFGSDIQRLFIKFNRLGKLFQRFISPPQTGKRTHFVSPIARFARELQILLIKLYDLVLHQAYVSGQEYHSRLMPQPKPTTTETFEENV